MNFLYSSDVFLFFKNHFQMMNLQKKLTANDEEEAEGEEAKNANIWGIAKILNGKQI